MVAKMIIGFQLLLQLTLSAYNLAFSTNARGKTSSSSALFQESRMGFVGAGKGIQ